MIDLHQPTSVPQCPPGRAALLATGEVRHTRLRPARHAFRYPTFFVLLPMRSWPAQGCPGLPRNRRGLLSFHDRDHGQGGDDALQWLQTMLQQEGIGDARGEIWLQTYPRVLGYVFKPVSFWYCHRIDGSLAAVVAEVNNTFGERHAYLLAGADLAWGRQCLASKVFHVSPFCKVEGCYRFRFFWKDDRIVARIEHDDDHGPLLLTSVSGSLAALDRARAARALLAFPLMTIAVMSRIHWQALRLWLKRVPFFRKPEAPARFVSRGTVS